MLDTAESLDVLTTALASVPDESVISGNFDAHGVSVHVRLDYFLARFPVHHTRPDAEVGDVHTVHEDGVQWSALGDAP